jgi:hypothetical protein
MTRRNKTAVVITKKMINFSYDFRGHIEESFSPHFFFFNGTVHRDLLFSPSLDFLY